MASGNYALALGTTLNDRYKILRIIGEGGMGVVYEAHDQSLSRQVAIKILNSSLARRKVTSQRFENEARAIATIGSEHIVEVYDIGRTGKGGIFGKEAPFMVMEFLKGGDLASILAKKGRLSHQEAVNYVMQALLALAQAHARGIVHRDLKPANLFLAKYPDGSKKIKVLDFGISKVSSDLGDNRRLTSDSQVLGSPAYMAPEQLRQSNKVDPRADIWSLGVILYELMTGRLPFDGSTTGALFAAILEKPPYPMQRYVPDLPVELERVVLRCLAKRADNRWPDVVELANGLKQFGPANAEEIASRIARLVSQRKVMTEEAGELEMLPQTELISSPPPASDDRSMMVDSDHDEETNTDLIPSNRRPDNGTFGEGRSITITGMNKRRPTWLIALVASGALGSVLAAGVALKSNDSKNNASTHPPETSVAAQHPTQEPAQPAQSALPPQSAASAAPVVAAAPPPPASAGASTITAPSADVAVAKRPETPPPRPVVNAVTTPPPQPKNVAVAPPPATPKPPPAIATVKGGVPPVERSR